MYILGIDPGYAIVGYGVVNYSGNKFTTVTYGAITTPAGMPFVKRLDTIFNEMTRILNTYKIEAMSVEKLFFNTNTTTAIDVAQARGVIVLAAERSNVPVFEYTPMQVKQAVVGYGKAEKKQVMAMTQRLLNMKEIPRPDDAADALALAICHARAATSLLNNERVFDPSKYNTR